MQDGRASLCGSEKHGSRNSSLRASEKDGKTEGRRWRGQRTKEEEGMKKKSWIGDERQTERNGGRNEDRRLEEEELGTLNQLRE